jgi:tRNA pseudouridine55 synthase
MATGLLVVLVGPATRLGPYLTSESKSYIARISFGSSTDTDDAEGKVLGTLPVPAEILDPEYAQARLDALLGESMQLPPAYSAIKVGGKVSHRAARAGDSLDLPERPIVVLTAQLLEIDHQSSSWLVEFQVSKGTYIRSLARDLGRQTGTLAHLSELRRTASGLLRVDAAHDLDTVAEAGESGDIASLFADPKMVFGEIPAVRADEKSILNGRSLPLPEGPESDAAQPLYAVYTESEELAALYRPDVGRAQLVAEVVLATPIASQS